MSDLHAPGPPPCKVLYSETSGWSDDAPEHLKLRPLRDIPDAEPAPRVQWVYARNAPPPRQQAESRAKPAKPRKSPKPADRIRCGGWNRNEAVTIERILDLQNSGLGTDKAIAEVLRCQPQLVSDRLMEYRKAFPEAAAAHAASLVCRCKRPKRSDSEYCHKCARSEAYKTATAKRAAEKRRFNQQIVELQAQGLSYYQIAVQLRTTKSNVGARLARMRREQRGRRSGEETR